MSKPRLLVLVALAVVPLSLVWRGARAQDAGPPPAVANALPPAAANAPTAAAPSASTTALASGATPSGTPPLDGEGEDPEHPPPSPSPSPPPPKSVVRQAAVVKDGMIRVPGGRFTMGSDDKKAPTNERPSRLVVVAPFWIDKTEVTVAGYRACVDRGACQRPSRASVSCTYDLGDPTLPVSCVPWTSAQAYCVAIGRRLPREVEWEMAARGTSAIKYPWGGASAAGCGAAVTLAGDKTQRSCGGKKPARVGSHPGGVSPYGVHDMSGNVEEWVADWYGESVSDLSPRAGASHVLRGGGWLTPPSLAKTTSRNWGSALEMGPTVGFRCARDD